MKGKIFQHFRLYLTASLLLMHVHIPALKNAHTGELTSTHTHKHTHKHKGLHAHTQIHTLSLLFVLKVEWKAHASCMFSSWSFKTTKSLTIRNISNFSFDYEMLLQFPTTWTRNVTPRVAYPPSDEALLCFQIPESERLCHTYMNRPTSDWSWLIR